MFHQRMQEVIKLTKLNLNIVSPSLNNYIFVYFKLLNYYIIYLIILSKYEVKHLIVFYYSKSATKERAIYVRAR